MATINILSDLALNGSLIVTKDNENFPENPSIGTLVLKEQVLYAYITIGSLSTWYPFSSKTNSYIHSQGQESSAWNITHNLGSTDIWYQVQDIYGTAIMPKGIINKTQNSLTIEFSAATVGIAILVGPDTVSAPSVETTSISVNDGFVLIDGTGIRVDGTYVTSGGSADIGPETTARIAADATLQANINAETTARIAADATLQAAISALGGATTEIISIAADTIDCSLGSFFKKTVSSPINFSFSNVPSTGAYLATVMIIHTSGTIGWPPSVTWPNSVAPTLTSGKTHIFNFLTDDGGITWRGSSLVDYS